MPDGYGVVSGTGHQVEVPRRVLGGQGAPEFDPRSGDHAWIMTGAWRVDPVAATTADGPPLHLDTENLLTVAGPGCWHCEREYTPELARRRCKGKP